MAMRIEEIEKEALGVPYPALAGAMRYEFHPEALEEYNQAGLHYAHKEPGLDLGFIVSVENAIESICKTRCVGVKSTRMSAGV